MYKYNWMQTLDTQHTEDLHGWIRDFLMWIWFTDPPNGHKVCIMQLNNLLQSHLQYFSLFNALKIRRNLQDVISIILKFYISKKEHNINDFSRTDCLLIGIPIHSHEQDIMVKKEDESYNFQYVILGNRVVWVILSSLYYFIPGLWKYFYPISAYCRCRITHLYQ